MGIRRKGKNFRVNQLVTSTANIVISVKDPAPASNQKPESLSELDELEQPTSQNIVGFQKGNQFWKERSSHGCRPTFPTPDDLWNAACEYFTWADENPLWEMKVFVYQGDVTQTAVPRIRAMTKAGMCLFIDITAETYTQYRNKPGFAYVTEKIDATIWGQKFAGAAADLLNANIIARDLGLRDKTDITTNGDDRAEQLGDTEAIARLVGILNRARERGSERDNNEPDGYLGAPDRPPG